MRVSTFEQETHSKKQHVVLPRKHKKNTCAFPTLFGVIFWKHIRVSSVFALNTGNTYAFPVVFP